GPEVKELQDAAKIFNSEVLSVAVKQLLFGAVGQIRTLRWDLDVRPDRSSVVLDFAAVPRPDNAFAGLCRYGGGAHNSFVYLSPDSAGGLFFHLPAPASWRDRAAGPESVPENVWQQIDRRYREAVWKLV